MDKQYTHSCNNENRTQWPMSLFSSFFTEEVILAEDDNGTGDCEFSHFLVSYLNLSVL